jgi:RHS repeat-associated protein
MTKMRRIVWLLVLAGLFAPSQVQAQTVEYYHLDALGSVRVVTDQNGTVLRRHDFKPFGEEVAGTVTFPNPDRKMFTGQERDSETGLDYFGARYYRAGLGRFTTVDPELNVKQALAEPQRWNRYAYVTDNPLKYTDPDGRDIWLISRMGGFTHTAIGVTGPGYEYVFSFRSAHQLPFDSGRLDVYTSLATYLAKQSAIGNTVALQWPTSLDVDTKMVEFFLAGLVRNNPPPVTLPDGATGLSYDTRLPYLLPFIQCASVSQAALQWVAMVAWPQLGLVGDVGILGNWTPPQLYAEAQAFDALSSLLALSGVQLGRAAPTFHQYRRER